MFIDFFYHLRSHGLKASTTEWLALIEALAGGHARAGCHWLACPAVLLRFSPCTLTTETVELSTI